MARLRNINRSEFYEDLVQKLARDEEKEGTRVFSTIKQLLCFAALIGFSQKRREALPDGGKVEDVQHEIFQRDNSMDYIYMIAVAETKDTDVLREDSDIDMIKIFEEYAHGGLGIIKGWMVEFAEDDGFRAIIQGLYKCGLIENEILTREDLIKSLEF